MKYLTFALALLASPVSAQSCFPTDVMEGQLARNYGESLQFYALDNSGRLVSAYANLETGSWTIAIKAPDGPSCMVATGRAFTVEEVVEETY